MTVNYRLLAVAALAFVGIAGGATVYMNNAEADDTKTAAATDTAAGTPTGKPLKDAIKADAVYATVDGDKLTGKEIQEFIKKLPPQLQTAPSDRLLEMIVNQIVNDKLVAKAAADQKLADDTAVKARIAEVTDQIVRERFVEKALDGKVTDAAIKAKYDEVMKATPDQNEIRASHILVKDEKTANEVLAKLAKGDDFAKLAKEYSIDPTKEQGGDLGYFVKAAMVPEFGDAAFTLKKGETTKTAVKSQFGYHVIKVVDIRPAVKPKLDQVKDRIRAQLNDEQIRKLVDDLRAKSKVEITIPKA